MLHSSIKKSLILLSLAAAIFVLVVVCHGTPVVVNAQTLPNMEVDLLSAPEIPKPNSTASLYVESFSTDLDRATITWNVNGKIVKQGVGEKRLSVEIGPNGSKTSVSVLVITDQKIPVNRRIDFNPSQVDLVWQADTYTPIFYRGKAMFAPGSNVTVTAIPDFGDGTPKNLGSLIYTWRRDGNVMGSQSGTGKRSVTIGTYNTLDPVTIDVTVVSVDRTYLASNTLTIVPTLPKIVFYEDTPAYGLNYRKTLTEKGLGGETISVVAYPFFFSINDPGDRNLQYMWTMNGQAIENLSTTPNRLSLKRDGEAQGTSVIGLRLQHLQSLLQGAQNAVSISFENIKNSGFGL